MFSKRFLKYVKGNSFALLCLLAIQALANFSHAEGPVCSSLFLQTPSISEEFQDFLSMGERFHFSWEKTSSYREFAKSGSSDLQQYFQHIVKYYESSQFKLKQDESLKTNLYEHGVRTFKGSARETLQELSRQNVARLLPREVIERMEQKISKDLELQALERLVLQIRLNPIHNTNHIGPHARWNSNIPLYSSKEISGLGAKEWFRNTQDFNRKILKSDDQVFFHIYMSLGERTSIPSVYGRGSISVDLAYAREQAWVSAFIMAPKDLETFAHRNLKGARFGNPTEAKEHLYKFDFTWEDFNYFYKTALLRSLVDLKAKNLKKYQEALEILNDDPGSYRAIALMRSLLPEFASFEMKVPLAVPGKFVQVL